MKIEEKFILTKKNGKVAAYDEAGCAVNINEMLEQFNPKSEDDYAFVIVKADDGKHEMRPFNIETARRLHTRNYTTGIVCTATGRKVRIFTYSAAGDYPIVGTDQNKQPMTWDKNGRPSTGEEHLRLYLQMPVGQPTPKKEAPGQEEETQKPSPEPEQEKEPEQEHVNPEESGDDYNDYKEEEE